MGQKDEQRERKIGEARGARCSVVVTGETGLNISQRISAVAPRGVARVEPKGSGGGGEKTCTTISCDKFTV